MADELQESLGRAAREFALEQEVQRLTAENSALRDAYNAEAEKRWHLQEERTQQLSLFERAVEKIAIWNVGLRQELFHRIHALRNS